MNRHPVNKAMHERRTVRCVEALRPHLFYNQPRRSYPRRRLSHIPSPLSFGMSSTTPLSSPLPSSSPTLYGEDDGASVVSTDSVMSGLELSDAYPVVVATPSRTRVPSRGYLPYSSPIRYGERSDPLDGHFPSDSSTSSDTSDYKTRAHNAEAKVEALEKELAAANVLLVSERDKAAQSRADADRLLLSEKDKAAQLLLSEKDKAAQLQAATAARLDAANDLAAAFREQAQRERKLAEEAEERWKRTQAELDRLQGAHK
ncbi:hypothetical protein BDW22DRAFT_685278 [Trametopsis cervina]|nr:hypothetical protein BDW22DRAFT_685278 [Trametopsis cervina]